MLSRLELTGRARTHLDAIPELGCALHRDVLPPFLAMRTAAAADGIDLVPYSAFRDFEEQVQIWNAKYEGRRPLYDRQGNTMNRDDLSPADLIDRILYWSALPGASRHHWGTDMDVIDAAAVPESYRVRLLPDEYDQGGVFRKLRAWLENHMESFGFFRPYALDKGGVSVEPWHISYYPVANAALHALSMEVLREAIQTSNMLGKDAVLRALPELYGRYVLNIAPPGAGLKGPSPA